MSWLSRLFRQQKQVTLHPNDNRLEVVTEGLETAASDLQSFVKQLRQTFVDPIDGAE